MCLAASAPLLEYSCPILMGSNSLPKGINHISVFAAEVLGHLLECRAYKWYTKGEKKLQLGNLIKKTNEASCLLTLCLVQGIWPRPCTIMLLGKFSTSSHSAWERTSLSLCGRFLLVLHTEFSVKSSTSSHVGLLALYLPTWLNNLFKNWDISVLHSTTQC